MPDPGRPVVLQVVNSNEPQRYGTYNHRLAKSLGISQLVLGGLIFVINIATIAWLETHHNVTGFYVSIFWIIAGSFGVSSASRKTGCTIITTMVMSILSALCVPSLVGPGVWMVSGGDMDSVEMYEDCGCNEVSVEGSDTTQTVCGDCVVPEELEATRCAYYALGALILIVAMVEFVVAIMASVVCCRAVCCCRKRIHSNSVSTTGESIVVVNNATGNVQNLALPAGFQVVPTAPDSEKQQLAALPEYTSSPPPAYSTPDHQY